MKEKVLAWTPEPGFSNCLRQSVLLFPSPCGQITWSCWACLLCACAAPLVPPCGSRPTKAGLCSIHIDKSVGHTSGSHTSTHCYKCFCAQTLSVLVTQCSVTNPSWPGPSPQTTLWVSLPSGVMWHAKHDIRIFSTVVCVMSTRDQKIQHQTDVSMKSHLSFPPKGRY